MIKRRTSTSYFDPRPVSKIGRVRACILAFGGDQFDLDGDTAVGAKLGCLNKFMSLSPIQTRRGTNIAAEAQSPKTRSRRLLKDYDIRPVVVHPTKRADFSRHGYRAA